MAMKFELLCTQTSTMVAFVCTLLITVALTVELDVSLPGSVLRLVHLGSFSAWLGIQIWVTFFAGITMYRYLPRHTFGYIQGKLFPKYFLVGTILSSVTLITFIVQNPLHSWKPTQKVQGSVLLLNVLMTACNMLYLEPQTTKCTTKKHVFEKEVSAGQAIGKVEKDKLEELRKIPEYVVLEKRFFSLHTYSAIGNLIALATQSVHLWYLSCYLTSI